MSDQPNLERAADGGKELDEVRRARRDRRLRNPDAEPGAQGRELGEIAFRADAEVAACRIYVLRGRGLDQQCLTVVADQLPVSYERVERRPDQRAATQAVGNRTEPQR